MNWTPTKRDIYLLATGQYDEVNTKKYYAKNISRFLRVTKQYVSKALNEMCTKGFLICDDKHAKLKNYSPTYKKPSFLVNQNLTALVNHSFPNKFEKSTGSSQPGVSKSQWKCPIKDLSKVRDLGDWKSYQMKNGVFKYFMNYDFDEPINNKIHFQMTVGPKNGTMTIVYPKTTHNNREDMYNFEKETRFYVIRVIKKIKKIYNIGMRPEEVVLIKDDNGIKSVEHEAELRKEDKNLIKNYVPIEGTYYDNGVLKKISYNGSGGRLNCESSHPEVIDYYLELPSFFLMLSDLLALLKRVLAELKGGEIIFSKDLIKNGVKK